jgi:hypothetical protein
MLVIDKSKAVQNLILTLSELTTIDNARYLLVLKNDAVRTLNKIILPDNTSLSTDRYDLFSLATPVFNEITTGYYTYSIYQQSPLTSISDETLLGDFIEQGKLLIKDLEVTETIAPVENKDYIVYYNG